jgi:uncharacterized protein YegP (UPF0339 family)
VVAFSEVLDTIPAFSDRGAISLPVTRRLIDVTNPDGKKERADLLVVYDSEGGHYLWRYAAANSPSEIASTLAEYKSRSSAIYVTSDGFTEFSGGRVIEYKGKSTGLSNAADRSIEEVQRTFPQARQTRGLKTFPFIDAPPLVGLENSPSWTKRLPGFKPIPADFVCVNYGERGEGGRCPHGTLVVSISRQADGWRLVLRNRYDVEVILDQKFDLVSTRQLTPGPPR